MSVAERTTPVSDPLIGARIDGRYLIEAIHGVGGMSIVYAGVHQDLRRRVAIKVLDGAWATDREVVERFLIEARTASALTHPNIVPVSDLGRLPDGRPYLVMPMIEGHDLATLLAQEGPQPPRRVATLLWGAALALDLIHRKGLVHRDIKSENLMHVSSDDGSETVLVLDFGIAGALGLPNVDNASGTPEFMPPEALNGALPDHRADVYALATVAFELLTGVLPYDSGDLQDLIAKKSSEAPRRMSDVGLARFPEPLETVVARGLSRRAQERHASASAFMREFEAAAAIAAPPDPVSEVSPISPVRSSSRESRTLLGTGIHFYPPRTPAPSATPTPTTGVRARKGTHLGTGPQAPISAEEADQIIAAAARAGTAEGARPADTAEGAADEAPRIVVSPAASAKAASVKAASANAKASRIMRNTRAPMPAGRFPFEQLPLPNAPPPAGKSERPRERLAPHPTLSEAPPPAGADPFAATHPMPQAHTPLPAFSEPPRTAPQQNVWRYSDDSLQPTDTLDEEGLEEFGGIRRRSRAPIYVGLFVAAAIAIALVSRSASTVEERPAAASSAPPEVAIPTSAPAAALEPPAVAPAPEPVPAAPPAAPAAMTPAPASIAAAPAPAAPEEPEATAPAAAAEPETSPRKGRAASRRAARTTARTTTAPVRAPRPAAPSPRLMITPAPEPPPAPPAVRPFAPRPVSAVSSDELAKAGTDAMLRGDLAAAAQKFDQAIAANPSDAAAHRGRALVLERQGRTREAAAAFREFLRLRPSGASSDKIRQRLEELEAGE